MKCPRCKYEHIDLVNGKLIPQKMEKCYMCAYPIVNKDQEKMVKHHCENMLKCIDSYLETRDRNYLIIAEAYLRVAINETQEDLPFRAEVSK